MCDKLGKNDIKRKFYKTVQMRTKTVFLTSEFLQQYKPN